MNVTALISGHTIILEWHWKKLTCKKVGTFRYVCVESYHHTLVREKQSSTSINNDKITWVELELISFVSLIIDQFCKFNNQGTAHKEPAMVRVCLY